MIHIVTAANRHLYKRQIWAMFEGRREAFVERCGWSDLMVFDDAELDDCDDEHAVYLLALNEDEDLLGAVRSRPTEDRCILADKFPELIAEGQPAMKGPEVWEATRVFTTPLYRETRQKGHHLLPVLALSAAEVAFDHGARRLVGMVDMQYWGARSDGPAHVQLTGLPAQYTYGLVGGTFCHISDDLLERLREALAQQVRVSYEVEDEDVVAFGSLAGVQRAVDDATRPEPFAVSDIEREEALSEEARIKFDVRAREIASIEALYARHDALAAPPTIRGLVRALAEVFPNGSREDAA